MNFPKQASFALLGLAIALSASSRPALAMGEDEHTLPGHNFAPGYYVQEQANYREYIARMSPENRAKLSAMQDKLMQMEMDNSAAMMKMHMDLAKARRDMEMFIISNGYPKEYGH